MGLSQIQGGEVKKNTLYLCLGGLWVGRGRGLDVQGPEGQADYFGQHVPRCPGNSPFLSLILAILALPSEGPSRNPYVAPKPSHLSSPIPALPLLTQGVPGQILTNATMVFDVELLNVKWRPQDNFEAKLGIKTDLRSPISSISNFSIKVTLCVDLALF